MTDNRLATLVHTNSFNNDALLLSPLSLVKLL